MTRPKVDDDRTERLEEIVDAETDLPASALSFDEQLEYLLDRYAGYRRDAERLGDRVDELKRELEEEREADTSTTSTGGLPR
ncbi:hypothetical protein EKH57_00005 (plasmid) [Halorubrum sp. BOL3-1]|uniref:hypothetical protein n=1 Tax=Halorubrum sp. BOL3-1 TaxID=2497325 RepID=UPI0010051363|nr:hypothetical protein [Halorubrum sp. BOL3-1]QAU11317.1 hypothetical protein EKH57_00005 [Halorubrum sp. BOL3-1]